MKIAVYGTLKQEYKNNIIKSIPLYNGYIKIDKISGIGFPMIKLGDKYKLLVEVYNVSSEELQKIDDYEGYLKENSRHNFYNRVKTKVYNIETNEVIENVFVYEFNDDISNYISDLHKINETEIYSW